ncbi:MAG: hypothetical protein AB8C13_10170 [Phycisphaerales bacterium]
MKTPNLLPSSRLSARKKFKSIYFWSTTVVTMLICVAIPAAAISVQYRSTHADNSAHIERFAGEISQTREAILPLKKSLAELEIVSADHAHAQTRIRWTSVLNTIASTTSPDIRVHNFSANISDRSQRPSIETTISIHTKTLSQAREFLVTLETVGLFDQLRMTESRRISSDIDAPVSSVISAVITTENNQNQPVAQIDTP